MNLFISTIQATQVNIVKTTLMTVPPSHVFKTEPARMDWLTTAVLALQVNMSYCLFVCLFVLGLTLLFNIRGHITMEPACSSGTLTNVLPHRNAMPQFVPLF